MYSMNRPQIASIIVLLAPFAPVAGPQSFSNLLVTRLASPVPHCLIRFDVANVRFDGEECRL